MLLHGSLGKGLGIKCPRDGFPNCSYVDAVDAISGDYTGRANVMLSWSWQYTVRTVVGALSRWCRKTRRDPKTVFVWQCALCCNQYRVEAKRPKKEWEPFDVFKELFERRVTEIGHILALLAPWDNPLYIKRMWCVFEFWMALQVKGCCLEIVLTKEEEVSFQSRLANGQFEAMLEVCQLFDKVQLQKAQTSSADDRRHILQLIDPMATNYDTSDKVNALNAQVVRRLQRWLVEAAADV